MHKMKTALASLVICAALAAVSLAQETTIAEVVVSSAGTPEVPAAVDAVIEEYKINSFDLLEISVYQEPDLNKTVRVSQDGFISFPLIGKVKVAGMDIISAEELMAEQLGRDYLVDPSVTVFIKEYNIKKVFVLGQVKTPGSYNIPQDKGLSVLESIVLAGGFTNVAAIDNTRIIRVEKGVKKYVEVKISDITKRGDKSKDIKLRPNDIVFIPERLF